MIQFHYGSGSPFAWRAWLALEHKQAPYEMHTISFSAGDNKKPEFGALNPRRKVPVIVDDGFALYESNAIVEYLEERFSSGAPLFPGDLRGRAVVRRTLLEADNYVGPSMNTIVRQALFKPEAEWDGKRIAEAVESLKEELRFFDKAMTSRGSDYLAGSLSAADFALYPMIALALRTENKRDIGVRGAIEASPRVEAWRKRMAALPIIDKTMPPHWRG